MRRILTLAILIAAGASAGRLSAQALGLPLYNTPVQPFHRSELGGYLSFPSPGGTAFMGQYRMGAGSFDVGFDAAILTENGTSVFGIGAEGRGTVLRHSADFPLDGAVIVGIGGDFASGTSVLVIPIGFSLGRALVPQGSTITITPYVQPTLFILAGNGASTTNFGLGLGADFKFTPRFGARFSAGLGDQDGVTIGGVWIH